MHSHNEELQEIPVQEDFDIIIFYLAPYEGVCVSSTEEYVCS